MVESMIIEFLQALTGSATWPVSPTTPLPVTLSGGSGSTASADASGTIASGGTAQAIFTGTPVNGFSISNPDPSNDLWVSDTTTAAANGTGSVRVSANGGYYATEPGYRPFHAVSIVGAVTGQKITARQW
jgi:hypothetical protein